MIADLEAEVDRQALLRNHEVITSLLFHNNVFICSYGKLYSLKLKLDKKIDKLDKSKDYCDIIEKEDLIQKLKRCNMNLLEFSKCGSCCFCCPMARAERVSSRVKKKKEQTFPRQKRSVKMLMTYFDEYCKLMSEKQLNFDSTESRKELEDILQNIEDTDIYDSDDVINPDTFAPMSIEALRLRTALSEERLVKSRISAIGFEPT